MRRVQRCVLWGWLHQDFHGQDAEFFHQMRRMKFSCDGLCPSLFHPKSVQAAAAWRLRVSLRYFSVCSLSLISLKQPFCDSCWQDRSRDSLGAIFPDLQTKASRRCQRDPQPSCRLDPFPLLSTSP